MKARSFDIGRGRPCRQIGIDLARFGGDESSVTVRYNAAVVGQKNFMGEEPDNVVAYAFDWQNRMKWRNEDTVYCVDAGGMGQGVMNMFYKAGKKLRAIGTAGLVHVICAGNLALKRSIVIFINVRAAGIKACHSRCQDIALRLFQRPDGTFLPGPGKDGCWPHGLKAAAMQVNLFLKNICLVHYSSLPKKCSAPAWLS